MIIEVNENKPISENEHSIFELIRITLYISYIHKWAHTIVCHSLCERTNYFKFSMIHIRLDLSEKKGNIDMNVNVCV